MSHENLKNNISIKNLCAQDKLSKMKMLIKIPMIAQLYF